jgi:hypothetical protein
MGSADLLTLADELGIDIPENLNRRFIIAELLEAAAEQENEPDRDIKLVEYKEAPGLDLPKSYNETAITALVRNPVWLYIYWDISDADREQMRRRQVLLSIVALDDAGNPLQNDSFVLPLAMGSRDQYVLLPAGRKAVRVELVLEQGPEKRVVLACSAPVRLPENKIDFVQAVTKKNIPPMLALSGFHEIVRSQYAQHRQSFSPRED